MTSLLTAAEVTYPLGIPGRLEVEGLGFTGGGSIPL